MAPQKLHPEPTEESDNEKEEKVGKEEEVVEEEEVLEEALSLCDLPIYSDSNDHWEYNENPSHDQDLFEFSSENFSNSYSFSSESIIFCGKIIPFKQPTSVLDDTCLKVPQKQSKKQSSKRKSKGFFKWGSFFCLNSRTHSRNTKKDQKKSSSCGYGYGFPMGKVSLIASPTKSRWHFFMFGLTRLPSEMELGDIKMRQNRKRVTSPSSMFRIKDGSEACEGGVLKNAKDTKRRSTSRHGNAGVKSSTGCLPRV